MKFYSSVRMDVRRVESLKVGSEVVGNHVRVKIAKNKVAPPFREAEFDLMFGQGISREGELIDIGVKLDLVQKSGSWFNMGETRLGQGKDNAKIYLKNNPEVAAALEAEIRRQISENGLPRGEKAKAAKGKEKAAEPAAAPAPVLVEDFEE